MATIAIVLLHLSTSGCPPSGSGQRERYPAKEMDETLSIEDVRLTRSGKDLLNGIDWQVAPTDRWIVIGANGSGKTSLIRIASLYEHPSSGRVVVAGEELGRADVRELRRKVALVSPALRSMVRPGLDCSDVVMSAKFAALEPWWHTYTQADVDRAEALLVQQGVGFAAGRPFSSLSTGEQQRVLLARALMGGPELVLLDEPCTGLDLGGREELIDTLSALASDPLSPSTVLVTHHVEEIPPGFTHLLALRSGRIIAKGSLDETLNEKVLSDTFGIDLVLTRHDDGRYSARRR